MANIIKRIAPALGIVAVLAACSSSSDDDADACCPVSDAYNCEGLLFAGAKSLQPNQECQQAGIDGTPQANKTTDRLGCPVWIATGPTTCGVVAGGRDAATG